MSCAEGPLLASSFVGDGILWCVVLLGGVIQGFVRCSSGCLRVQVFFFGSRGEHLGGGRAAGTSARGFMPMQVG